MNPDVLAFCAALRGVLIAVGAIMVYLNLGHTQTYAVVMQAAGGSMVLGPMIWAVFEKLVTLKKTLAAAVQAGINLATSGRAVDAEGQPISKFASGATPPKQVTVETSAAIIKSFAPAPGEIAKS